MSVPTIPEPRKILVSQTARRTRRARNLRVPFFSLLHFLSFYFRTHTST
jgi:hypothetical protein